MTNGNYNVTIDNRKEVKKVGDSKSRVHYLRKRKKKECRKRNCYKTIGNYETACKYTKDIRHAKNFQKMLQHIPQADFWEKETASKELTQSQD